MAKGELLPKAKRKCSSRAVELFQIIYITGVSGVIPPSESSSSNGNKTTLLPVQLWTGEHSVKLCSGEREEGEG